MSIKVYNTLTKQKEEFVPIHPGKANIYVCAVTPYNHPHVGAEEKPGSYHVIA